MEPMHKSSLFRVLLCFLALSGCTEAHQGNCTEEDKIDHLDKCAANNLKVLQPKHIFDVELWENAYKDPLKFVTDSELCKNPQEAADFMECSVKVFEDCATNSSLEDAHTSPAKAMKAVEQFCEGLNMILKKVNMSEFQDCVRGDKADVIECETDYLIQNEKAATKDICSEHKLYVTCMSELDKCGEDEGKKQAIFSTWANLMVPQKCETGGASGVVATLWVVLAASLLSVVQFARC